MQLIIICVCNSNYSDTTDFTALRDAINEVSGETGVVASFFEGDVVKNYAY